MKRILTSIIAIVLVATSAFSASKNLRIGSYNLRMHQLDQGDNVWELRKGRLAQSFKDNDFDLAGLQEVSSVVQGEIASIVGEGYECRWFSPYSADGAGNKACGFIFKKDRLELLETNFFWPGENPDVMSVNDPFVWVKTGKKSKFKRGALCAMFKDRKTGKKFFFMVSHGILNKENNAAFAHCYIDREKMYNPEGLPSFFVGDLNTTPDSPSSALFRTYWTDSFDGAKAKSGPEFTFNGFKNPNGKTRIDFIYCRGKVKALKYVCNNTLYSGLYASDHFPIYLDVKL